MRDETMRELREKLIFSDELMNDVFDAYECECGRDDVHIRDYTRRMFLKFCHTKPFWGACFKGVWREFCEFGKRIFGHIGLVLFHFYCFFEEIFLSFRIFTRPLKRLVRLYRVYRKHRKEIEALLPIVTQILELEKGEKCGDS